MRPRFSLLAALLLTACAARGASAYAEAWARLSVPPIKTSIYIGSVTLTPSVFVRHGDTYTATYAATVWPWFPWNESGSVTINVPAADLERIVHGETVEFTGSGADRKGRPRTVSGRAQATNAHGGKLKLRIKADGIELVFNGTYTIGS